MIMQDITYEGRHRASADYSLCAAMDPAYVGKHRAESTS